MMRRSSNVGMATLETQVIGDKRFAQGLEDLGIGQATGIDFPGEADGIVKPIGNMSRIPVEYCHLDRVLPFRLSRSHVCMQP